MDIQNYLTGLGNYHHSEAIANILPKDQNSPQKTSLGLYTEQLSGSSFTTPRAKNLRSWLYRLLPSVVQDNYKPYNLEIIQPLAITQAPNPMRWSAHSQITKDQNFIDGLFHIASNTFLNTFIYQCNKSMEDCYFSSYDGELLFIPYHGDLILHTEFGVLIINPGKIAVIPRGVKFKVSINKQIAFGYLCENRGSPLALPSLGPIGANGLANPRHFLFPHAAFESQKKNCLLICKYHDKLWSAQSNHSPLNVVGWHGNYAPYFYDLSMFNTINTVSFDHPDPSIFTVLTAESAIPGVAILDFVVFPPRWLVAEHTFRPPYFHRNIMNEFMGLIYGSYDAKKEGFNSGGVSIHNCMVPHGPDGKTYSQAINEESRPVYYNEGLAFMFETNEPWLITQQSYEHQTYQKNYSECWQNLTGSEETNNLSLS